MAKQSASTKSKTSINKIENELKKLKKEASNQNINADRIIAQSTKEQIDNETRQEIAKLVTWLYFGILLLVLAGIPTYNLIAFAITNGDEYKLDLIDTLQGYQAVVGTLIGFVIAYYFKEKSD